MKKLFTIIICCVFASTAFSQTFIIPEAKKTTKKRPPKPWVGTGTPGKGSGGQGGKIGPTICPPPKVIDPTTGRVVEGIKRSATLEETIKELEDAANKGDVRAHTALGMYYFQKDDNLAFSHLLAASEAGDSVALYYLGGVYYLGRCGVETDKAKAASYYLQAALQDNALAQYAIGKCLYEGEGVEQDLKAAKEWMEKSAQNGCEDATSFLDSQTFE